MSDVNVIVYNSCDNVCTCRCIQNENNAHVIKLNIRMCFCVGKMRSKAMGESPRFELHELAHVYE